MCLRYRTRRPQQRQANQSTQDRHAGGGASEYGVSEYGAWNWPVTCHEDRVLLTIGGTTTALLVPVGLADRVQPILAARSCPVPVLTHPDAPAHRVFVAGEPYGAPLPWPQSVQAVGGTLPLPPTVTPHGRFRWHSSPDRHQPDTSREIDIFAAVQTRLRETRRSAEGATARGPGPGR